MISAGVYGYPTTEAIKVALETIEATIQDADLEVVLVLFDQETKNIADKMYL